MMANEHNEQNGPLSLRMKTEFIKSDSSGVVMIHDYTKYPWTNLAIVFIGIYSQLKYYQAILFALLATVMWIIRL